ncbi:MAG: lambda-exonuclease family protein [Pseudomonadota bacterium]
MKLINLEQGSTQWLNMRQEKITATDAAVIMGISPFCSPYKLWKRKLGLESPQYVTEAMKRGMRLEDEARKSFEQYTDIQMEPAVIESDDNPWMMASLDGIDTTKKHQLEIKCPNPKTHEMAKNKQLPKYYFAQIQHQLAVTGNDWSYYFSYDGKEGALVEVERDDAFITEMLEKESEFYRMLKEFDPPAQSHLVIETDEMKKAASDYMEANTLKKKATELEKKARQKLLEISDGRSIQGFGVRLSHYFEKGRVDYNAIPELQGLNLDSYRKAVTGKSRLTFV